MLFRRRTPDPARAGIRAAFDRVAVHVERAQRSLLAAIPTARDPGVPLAQALAAFSEQLAAASAGMASWRDPMVEELWRRCEQALVEARSEAERLRIDAAPDGFEQLNARIGDVLDPLETFADAERELRRHG